MTVFLAFEDGGYDKDIFIGAFDHYPTYEEINSLHRSESLDIPALQYDLKPDEIFVNEVEIH